MQGDEVFFRKTSKGEEMATGDKKDERYDRLKRHNGARYSGMKVGGTHKWNYDAGVWKERKTAPDDWDIYYETRKHRAGHAPEGSGAPAGTQYNWLIITHQRVDKLDANTYMTYMEGKKFKVSHKRASKEGWNISEQAQKKRVIGFLEQVISDLKAADENTPVPYVVGGKERIYGLDHRNKKELYDMAAKRNVKNRSRMSRGELLEAVRETLKDVPAKEDKGSMKSTVAKKLQQRSKGDLYRMADKKAIRGRSKMKKADLVKVLKKNVTPQELGL